MHRALCVVIIGWTILSGCRGDAPRHDGKTAHPRRKESLIIAVIPEHNVFEQRRQYKPLCDYLARRLQMKVYLKTLPSYGMILDEFRRGRVNAAFFGSFSYVLAHAQVGAHILARPEYIQGGADYRAYIFARKSSGIRTLQDIRGKRYAFVHPMTTAGYLFERAYLGLETSASLRAYFKDYFFAGSHDASALAVFEGRADCGGGKDRVFERLARQNPAFAKQMVVLAQSPPVPSNGFAISKEWPGRSQERLQRLLLNLHRDSESAGAREALGINRFILTQDKDYAPVVEMARTAGIDLATYRGDVR